MLNSAACRMKTARAPAGAPTCEKSSRSKGLTPGHRARYRRADETSRHVFQRRTAALARASGVEDRRTVTNLDTRSSTPKHAIDATDLNSSRLRYDGQAAQRCSTADHKSEPCPAVAVLLAVGTGHALHMRQERHGRDLSWSEHILPARARVFGSCDCDMMTDAAAIGPG